MVAELVPPFERDGIATSLSVSVGMAMFPEDADSLDALAPAAELAMCSVAASGGSGFRAYVQELERPLLAAPVPRERGIEERLALVTPRERQVLDRVVAGQSTKATAATRARARSRPIVRDS